MSSSLTEDWNELLNTIFKISPTGAQTIQGNRKDYLRVCRTIKRLQNLSQRVSHPLYIDLIDAASYHAQSIGKDIWNALLKIENNLNFEQELIEERMIPHDLLVWPKLGGSLFYPMLSNLRKAGDAVLEEKVSINVRKLYSLGTSTRPQSTSMWYHLSLKNRIALGKDWNGALEGQILTHEIQEDCEPNNLVGLSLDDCKQIWSRIENMNLDQWLITWNDTTILPPSLMEQEAFIPYIKRYKNENYAPLKQEQENQPRGSMTVDRHSSDEIGLEDQEMSTKKVQSPYIIDFSNDWSVGSLVTEVGNQSRKPNKPRHQTNSSGYAVLAAHFFIHHSLTKSCPQGERCPKLLIIGQKGSGKAALCKLCAGWVGAQVHELNLQAIHQELITENAYTKNEYLIEALQTKISSIFSTAMKTRPAIVLIRDVERVFITNSDRDKESPVAKLARSMKQLLIEKVDKSQGLEKLIIVATSSYPDDCVGKDSQEFRNFFHSIVHLPLPSPRSRAIKIREALGKFNKNENQEDETPKWGLITAVADEIVGCTLQDIDHSMQQACGTLPENTSLIEALQLFKIYMTSTRDVDLVNKRRIALTDWFCLALPTQSPKQSKQSIKRSL
eukprot:jgi/Picsp_1/952/NSC_04436-R1_aaa family protein